MLTGSVPTAIGTITTLTTLSICNNHLSGDLPSALRTGVTLLGYPTADGYTPVACQTSSIVFDLAGDLFVISGVAKVFGVCLLYTSDAADE